MQILCRLYKELGGSLDLVSKGALETILRGHEGLRGNCLWKPDGLFASVTGVGKEFSPENFSKSQRKEREIALRET